MSTDEEPTKVFQNWKIVLHLLLLEFEYFTETKNVKNRIT